MLRCPVCGQTAYCLVPSQTEGGPGYRALPFDDAAKLDAGTELMCPYCHRTATLAEWQAAALRPDSDWDEEEDLGEITHTPAVPNNVRPFVPRGGNR